MIGKSLMEIKKLNTLYLDLSGYLYLFINKIINKINFQLSNYIGTEGLKTICCAINSLKSLRQLSLIMPL